MASGIKYTQEHVEKDFEEHGYKLLSTYKNLKTHLEYICSKHEKYGVQKITYGNFLRGRGCPFCRLNNGEFAGKIPDIIVKERTENKGYIYVSHEYKNQHCLVNFICTKHRDKGVQQVSLAGITKANSCNCSYCLGLNRTTEEFQEILNEKFDNSITVIGEYIGTKERVEVKCNICSNIWKPYAYNLLSGYGCKECGHVKVGIKGRRDGQSVIDEINEKRGNEMDVLSKPEEIITSDIKVKLKCKKCGHIWEAKYSNILKPKSNRTGCPECNCKVSKGERILREILRKYNFSIDIQYKFEDCKDINSLPFDAYDEINNIAYEYDGEHHYKIIPRKKNETLEEGQARLKLIQKHDQIKTNYCKNNNIFLIRIPYWERDNMEDFILDKLREINIKV